MQEHKRVFYFYILFIGMRNLNQEKVCEKDKTCKTNK